MRITSAVTAAALVSTLPLRIAALAADRWLEQMHAAGARNAAAAVAERADEHRLLDARIADLAARHRAPLASVVG
jgi:hypothetical protein